MEEEIVKISMLLEIYGNLLTTKQYNSINMYYNDDFSLSEIAEEEGISRQAVRDNITNAKEKLFNFEEKLKIYEKQSFNNKLINDCLTKIKKTNLSEISDLKNTLKGIEENLNSLKKI